MSLLLVARRGLGKGYIAMPPGGGIHAIKISRRLAQDLVGLPKLAVLPLQGLQLGAISVGTPARAPLSRSAFLTHSLQRLRRAADLGRDRDDRRPARRMLASRDPKPSAPRGRGPQAKTCSSSCLSWLHLLRSWSLRQTRRGSVRVL